jgi:hypothetical protein
MVDVPFEGGTQHKTTQQPRTALSMNSVLTLHAVVAEARTALMYDASFGDSTPRLIIAATAPRSITGGATPVKRFADRAVMFLLVVAAVALGNAARVLLFCILALAKLTWTGLTLVCRIGMRAIDRLLAPIHRV